MSWRRRFEGAPSAIGRIPDSEREGVCRIDASYPLREAPSADYAQRSEWNVRDSDATLVLLRGAASGGTAFTIEVARRLRRPLLVLDLRDDPDPEPARLWLERERVAVLNVAGPRESERPGIGAEAGALPFSRTVRPNSVSVTTTSSGRRT